MRHLQNPLKFVPADNRSPKVSAREKLDQHDDTDIMISVTIAFILFPTEW